MPKIVTPDIFLWTNHFFISLKIRPGSKINLILTNGFDRYSSEKMGVFKHLSSSKELGRFKDIFKQPTPKKPVYLFEGTSITCRGNEV